MSSLRQRVAVWSLAGLGLAFLLNLGMSFWVLKQESRANRLEKYRLYLNPVIADIELQRGSYDPKLEHIITRNKALVDLVEGDPLLSDGALYDIEGRQLLTSDLTSDLSELGRTAGQLERPERFVGDPTPREEQDIYYFPLQFTPEGGARQTFAVFSLRIDVEEEGQTLFHRVFTANLPLLAVFLGIGLLFYGLLTVYVRRPLLRLVHFADEAARRNFRVKIPLDGRKDEIGELTGAFVQMSGNLKDILGKIQSVSLELFEVSEEVGGHMNQVVDNSKRQSGIIEGTASFVEETNRNIHSISEHSRKLNQSATESSSSVLELSASIEEVADNIEYLSRLVDDVAVSIEELAGSVGQTGGALGSLSSSMTETSSSMNAMDQSIKQIDRTVEETRTTAEVVRDKAHAGLDSVEQTIAGILKIRESSEKVGRVIDALSQSAVEIGEILNVIDDVTEETNLLSLNAAIIAAQAGEHGKGFEVVADEIKDLAERTAASSKEIASLIKTVQKSTRDATQLMRAGARDVEGGVELAKGTGQALQDIHQSVETSNRSIQGIARESAEIANASRQITKAVQAVASTLKEIGDSVARQREENDKLVAIGRRMRDTTQQVKRSADEQALGSHQIATNIENISEMVQYIDRSTAEQSQESGKVLAEIFNIRDLTSDNVQALMKVHRIIRNLTGLAEMLKQDVDEFKL